MEERSTFGADKAENNSGTEHDWEILDTPADRNYEELDYNYQQLDRKKGGSDIYAGLNPDSEQSKV